VSSLRRFSSGGAPPGISSPSVTSNAWFQRLYLSGLKCSACRPSLSQPSWGESGGRRRSLASIDRPGRLRYPAAGACHVVSAALATAGEVLAKGDQPLVQLAGQHGDAVHTGVMPEPVAGHAHLAAAGLEQHVPLQVRPVFWRVKRTRRRSNATNRDPHHQASMRTPVLARIE